MSIGTKQTQEDEWNKPSPPLAPGLRMGPPPALSKIELEPVEPEGPVLPEVEELRLKVMELKRDNQILMNQIEEAWAVIKSRDETIAYLHQGVM